MTETAPPDFDAALEATWPALRIRTEGPWTFRDGAGGGKRVSATTADGAVGEEDLYRAVAEMTGRGERPLFRIRPSETSLDAMLARRGFSLIDRTLIHAIAVDTLAEQPLHRLDAIASEGPLAVMTEIWEAAGIGSGRRAVMDRAPSPKTWILGRKDDAPAGTAFAALSGGILMVHAIEIRPSFRRRGVATAILKRAARWGRLNGSRTLAVAATAANAPATALYASLGMQVVEQYHYRIAKDAIPT